jgi:tetratricopeptide (TPR) repeat protein
MRYRLLETVHAYAAEQLVESGERMNTVQKHAAYYLHRAEEVDNIRTTDWPGWRGRGWSWLEAELPNIRSILDRCRTGEISDRSGERLEETGLRLVASAWWFWCMHDRWFEAWRATTTHLEVSPGRTTPARFWVNWYAGITGGVLGLFNQSAPKLEEARSIALQLNDHQLVALADGAVGQDFLHRGLLDEAREFNERALHLARGAGPQFYLPIFLYNAGWTALRQGRLLDARDLLDESVAVGKQVGDAFALGIALPLRASVSVLTNDLAGAEELLFEAKHLSESVPNRGLGLAIIGLGRLSLVKGHTGNAARYFATALEYAVDIGRRILVCEALEGLAFVAEQSADVPTSIRLLAATDVLRHTMYPARTPDYRGRVEAGVERMRHRLGDSEYLRIWRDGSRRTQDEAIALGRAAANSALKSGGSP